MPAAPAPGVRDTGAAQAADGGEDSGGGSYFANSWNLVILSLEKDLADIYAGRLGSSGGETDGGLLILHTVKNYTVAPAQLQHAEETNQHGNARRGETRTKGKSKPMKISPL